MSGSHLSMVMRLSREAEEAYRHDAYVRFSDEHLKGYIYNRLLYYLHRAGDSWQDAETRAKQLRHDGVIEEIVERFERSVSLLERLAIQAQEAPF